MPDPFCFWIDYRSLEMKKLGTPFGIGVSTVLLDCRGSSFFD